jgi:hypothetical protein
MSIERRPLPPRRKLVTQKARVADQRTVYPTLHDDPLPAEIFVWIKGDDCTAELVCPL